MFFLWLKKSAIISLINQMCPAGCSWEHLHDLTDKVWVERRLCKLWGCSIKQPLCFYWKHPHTQIHNPGAEHINNPTQTHMHMLPHLHTQLCILIPQVVSIPSQCAGGFMKLLRVQVLLWVCFHEFIERCSSSVSWRHEACVLEQLHMQKLSHGTPMSETGIKPLISMN